MFVDSLLCSSGCDTCRRFILISLACYGLTFLSHLALNKEFLLILLFIIPILQFSAIRRNNDTDNASIFCYFVLFPFLAFSTALYFERKILALIIIIFSAIPFLWIQIENNSNGKRKNKTGNNKRKDYYFGYWHQELYLKIGSINKIDPIWNGEIITLDEPNNITDNNEITSKNKQLNIFKKNNFVRKFKLCVKRTSYLSSKQTTLFFSSILTSLFIFIISIFEAV